LALYCALRARRVDLVESGDLEGSSLDSKSIVSWPWSSVCGRISTVSIPLIETRKQKKIAFYSRFEGEHELSLVQFNVALTCRLLAPRLAIIFRGTNTQWN
jgi:hypothetical protein